MEGQGQGAIGKSSRFLVDSFKVLFQTYAGTTGQHGHHDAGKGELGALHGFAPLWWPACGSAIGACGASGAVLLVAVASLA